MYKMLFSLGNINNGALAGIKVMPQKDSTSDNTSNFSIGRRAFVGSYTSNTPTVQEYVQKKWIGGNRDASQVTNSRRNNRIGNGSLNASGNLMSFTTYKDVNTVDNALRRVRSGGAVPPPKKAVSPSYTYGPTPGYAPSGSKTVYGIKQPVLYH
jgi:hypothetical protein